VSPAGHTHRPGPAATPDTPHHTGNPRAHHSDRGEVRMLASGGHQAPGTPLLARPLGEGVPGKH
ncbi:DUF6296 family protein, partial [Streptomyces sp. NPDC059586]|uniref:DUF6296 family protein n=1 Tax=Streptomyces sp. NPDC059586 TaxID=3346876 RepID=UPI00367BBB7A